MNLLAVTMEGIRPHLSACKALDLLLLVLLGSMSAGASDGTLDPLGLDDCTDLNVTAQTLKCTDPANKQNCSDFSLSNNAGEKVMDFSYDFLDQTILSDSCLLLTCVTSGNPNSNLSCSLYKHDCSPRLCAHDNEEKAEESSEDNQGAVTGLAVLVALLGVALIIAIAVIIVLALCIRELQNEGGQKRALPNPCASILPVAACSCVLLSRSEQSETKTSSKKHAKPQNKPPAQDKQKKAPKRETKREEDEVEGADHDPDDYEEMDLKQREESFTDEMYDEDLYQNT